MFITNSAETIRKNAPFISVNTAMGIDIFGNVWADFVDTKRFYSGVGGQPDFIRAVNNKKYGAPIIAIKSITDKGESKIVKAHPQGISLTASSYDSVVLVTEYGIADLRGLTSGLKALAIASIAHPKYRDELLRYIYEDSFITKTLGYYLGKTPDGVTMYSGSVTLK
jgi:4-hydroxybutyrate CoA-transferase